MSKRLRSRGFQRHRGNHHVCIGLLRVANPETQAMTKMRFGRDLKLDTIKLQSICIAWSLVPHGDTLESIYAVWVQADFERGKVSDSKSPAQIVVMQASDVLDQFQCPARNLSSSTWSLVVYHFYDLTSRHQGLLFPSTIAFLPSVKRAFTFFFPCSYLHLDRSLIPSTFELTTIRIVAKVRCFSNGITEITKSAHSISNII